MKTGWILAFVVTILGSAAAALLLPYIQGMDTGFGKIQFGQAKTEKQAEPKATEKQAEPKLSKKEQAILLIEEGKQAEMKEDWDMAVEKYARARKLWPVQSLKMRWLAVKAVREALDCTKRGRLEGAMNRYEACQEHIHNKEFVSRKLETLKEYEAEYKKGVTSYKAGNFREAIPFFINAKALAAKGSFRSNADKLCREVESHLRKEKEKSQVIESVLNSAAARGDWFVVLALCRQYRSDADLSGMHDALAVRENKARGSITANPAEFPAARMDEGLKLQTIHFKGGQLEPLMGQIASESGIAVKIAVQKNGKTVNRMILKKKIERIEKQTDIRAINKEKAATLLRRAATQWQNKNADGLLRIAGQIYHEFSDLEIASDEQAQMKIAGLPMGLDGLIAKAAKELETKALARKSTPKEDKKGVMGTTDPLVPEAARHKKAIDAAKEKSKSKPKRRRTTKRVIFN